MGEARFNRGKAERFMLLMQQIAAMAEKPPAEKS